MRSLRNVIGYLQPDLRLLVGYLVDDGNSVVRLLSATIYRLRLQRTLTICPFLLVTHYLIFNKINLLLVGQASSPPLVGCVREGKGDVGQRRSRR